VTERIFSLVLLNTRKFLKIILFSFLLIFKVLKNGVCHGQILTGRPFFKSKFLKKTFEKRARTRSLERSTLVNLFTSHLQHTARNRMKVTDRHEFIASFNGRYKRLDNNYGLKIATDPDPTMEMCGRPLATIDATMEYLREVANTVENGSLPSLRYLPTITEVT
jgi:hypothetical protein